MHTDYTVSTHDISIFDKYFVVFVRCTYDNQQLAGFYSSTCGMHLTQTVIAQWSKEQLSNLVVQSRVSSDPNVCTSTFNHCKNIY